VTIEGVFEQVKLESREGERREDDKGELEVEIELEERRRCNRRP